MAISTDMLVAFVKVADHLSVSAAAVDLGISKGVVSKRVAQLEQAARATLFSRSTRKMALTPAGEIYLDFARTSLLAVNSADERVRELRSDLTGQIRVTAPISWGQKVLAKVIPLFLAKHPAIEIELVLDDRIMDIAYERVDIALRMTTSVAQDLVSIPLARLDWVICAAPAYLGSAGIPKHPDELTKHPCMNYWRVISDDSWQLACNDRAVTVRVHSRFRANNPDAVVDATLAGLGIALLPVYVCDHELATGRLTRVLPEWAPVTKFGNQITAIVAPDRIRFSRNQFFLNFLKERLL
jgi:DNA-binding transcriptional LysR family regulator